MLDCVYIHSECAASRWRVLWWRCYLVYSKLCPESELIKIWHCRYLCSYRVSCQINLMTAMISCVKCVRVCAYGNMTTIFFIGVIRQSVLWLWWHNFDLKLVDILSCAVVKNPIKSGGIIAEMKYFISLIAETSGWWTYISYLNCCCDRWQGLPMSLGLIKAGYPPWL